MIIKSKPARVCNSQRWSSLLAWLDVTKLILSPSGRSLEAAAERCAVTSPGGVGGLPGSSGMLGSGHLRLPPPPPVRSLRDSALLRGGSGTGEAEEEEEVEKEKEKGRERERRMPRKHIGAIINAPNHAKASLCQPVDLERENIIDRFSSTRETGRVLSFKDEFRFDLPSLPADFFQNPPWRLPLHRSGDSSKEKKIKHASIEFILLENTVGILGGGRIFIQLWQWAREAGRRNPSSSPK